MNSFNKKIYVNQKNWGCFYFLPVKNYLAIIYQPNCLPQIRMYYIFGVDSCHNTSIYHLLRKRSILYEVNFLKLIF